MADTYLTDSVQRFVAQELAPQAAQVDRDAAFPADRWERIAAFGLTGLVVPPEYGGVGVNRSSFAEILGRVSGACASTAWALLTHCTATAILAANGTDAQKSHYLPDLAAGRLRGAVAVTETGGGSNPDSIRTLARATDGGYELSGGKFFISQAGVADLYVIVVKTTDGAGVEGLSSFLVEKGDAGLSFGRREDTLGMHGVEIREIFLDRCRLPADRLIGRPGAGRAVLGSVSGITLTGAGAAALGVAQAAHDDVLRHVRDRVVLGKPLAEIGAVQARIGALASELEGMRAWLDRALAWLESGTVGAPVPLWMAKVAITQAAVRVADACLALHGAVGYSRALPLERHVRDVRAFCVHWGNNDVLTDLIAKAAIAAQPR